MKLSRIIALILSITIIAFIFYKIGLEKLFSIFKNFNFSYLPLIIIILIFGYLLAGLNTWVITKPFRKKTSLFYIIKATFITLVYAAITPGKIADLLMIPFLKKQNLNLDQAIIVVGFDKVISLFVKIIFGLIGAIFIFKKIDFLYVGIPLITFFVVILIILLISSKKFLNFIKNHLFRKYFIFFKKFSRDFKFYIKKNKKYIYYNTLITIIKNFFEALLFFVLFLAFGQLTNVLVIFFIFSLLSVIMLLTFPIGISGFGVRELFGIIVFGTVGVDAAIVFNSFILRIFLIYIINFFTIIFFREDLNFLKGSKIFKKIKFYKN